jgi:hypothetical protein
MKAPDLRKWDPKSEMEGLLFFAQSINELLFDYTIDTYKIPALNSRTLALELLNSIEESESGFLKQGAINPIIEELVDRLKKDPVVMEIIKNYFGEFIGSLCKEARIPGLKTNIKFLVNKIQDKYFNTSKKLLVDALLTARGKENITSLTRIYITELIYRGYSPQFIYFESDRFFFSGSFPARIDKLEIVNEYLNLFKFDDKLFDVIYRASKIFGAIREYAYGLGIEIHEDASGLSFRGESKKIESFLDKNNQCPLYLKVKDIRVLDPFSAREIADRKLFLIESLAKYHVHRGELVKSESALVYSSDQSEFGIYRKPNPSVLKRPDRILEKLSTLVRNTISVVGSKNVDSESLQRLIRALGGHHNAIRSETPERQLLEFWSAIEVLFPPTSGETDRISQISGAMACFVSSEYAAKLAADLYFSIRNSGCAEAIRLLNQIPDGINPIEKCLALFSIKTNEQIREQFYRLFDKHPLLKTRIEFLSTRFSSSDLVLKTLKAHIERVIWQIHRIYRARNLIIHSGKTLPYTNILVENLHSYLDRVLDIVHERIFHTSHATTIDQIALEVKLESESHLTKLKHLGKTECTADNFKLVLFGNK